MSRRIRLRPTLDRLGLVLLGLAILGLAGEGLVRLYLALPPPDDATHVADPDAGFRIRPGYGGHPEDDPAHINAFGFRDTEHGLVKLPGTIRVIGIGDSFVFGAGPPRENFLRVAETELAAGLGETASVEMISMGLGGYSPENEVGVLRSIALDLDPDVVVLCFFVGNDVTGIPIRAEVLHGRRYFTGARRGWHRLLRRSRLFVLVEHALVRWKHSREATGWTPSGPIASDGDDAAPSRHFLEIQRARLPVYARAPEPWVEALWREALSYLDAFDRLCDEAGVPWVLFVIPSEIQVDPEVRRAVLSDAAWPDEALDIDDPQRRLERFAREADVVLVDPLDAMRRLHAPGARLYIPNDTHWSTRGNQVAGEILAEGLHAVVRGRRR